MGNLLSFFSSLFSLKKEVRILMLGLDSAGKTTILYRLASGETVQTIPTVGFNLETVAYKNINFKVWDLGGQTNIRPYWRCYYQHTDAIIFIVDSADTERIGITQSELAQLLQEDELKSCPMLVFANKQDLPNALPVATISADLGLSNIRDRQWAIFKCSGLKGWGLEEGLDWLVTIINQSINANMASIAANEKKDANNNNNATTAVNTADNNTNNSNDIPVDNSPQQPSATPSGSTTTETTATTEQ
eukprot:TRINITY_DN9306_c0_g1_i1.p1 TRINITY_DN9306_c0_g1~~TRINITY_DN9306_c0_g1_i1.p1  ORF type:complete len:247 (+),score=51.35 TRINITY_DN9306_c0_g1_i1:15-755(+)